MRECDNCNSPHYTAENPRVFLCQQRPSDPSEMVCTLAGHKDCFVSGGELPQITATSAVGTAAQLEAWIESPEAGKAGFVFLTL
jgi:hypothetical protein